MINTKFTLIFTLLFFTSSAIADEVAQRALLISTINDLVIYIGIFLGLLLIISGFYKMKLRSESPNNPISSMPVIISSIIAGTMLLNYSAATTTVISTLLGSDNKYCFVLDTPTDEQVTPDGGCWNSGESEITGKLMEKIADTRGGNAAAEFAANFNVIVGLFQLIGLIYFFKGVYGLKTVGDGTEKGGYGKPIVMMIFAALLIDLPHTAEMFSNAMTSLGAKVG
jgi:hypothetical protein